MEIVKTCTNEKLLKHIEKVVKDIVHNNPCTNDGQPYQADGEYTKAYIRERIIGLPTWGLNQVSQRLDVVVNDVMLIEAESKAKY